MKRKHQRGFTLMELMVVIVIVAILAAVAVPLYINYVNDARRTEARGAIGAIVTAEARYFQEHGTYGNLNDLGTMVDLTDVQMNWTFAVTPNGNTGFQVVATGQNQANNLSVTLVYTRGQQPVWTET